MLNKQDLSAIESLTGKNFRIELKPIKEDIQKIRVELKKEIKPIKEDIRKVRADQKVIISFFDKEYLELRKRVELIENRLGLSSRN